MEQKNSRTKNYVLITASSGIYRVVYIVLNFVTRTVFIYTLGEEYLGLNSLFITVLNMLSLTELGIGSAVTFYLYKPIAQNDEEKINTLVAFFKRAYIVIGCAIAVMGLVLMPFLDRLVNFETELDVNLYAVYFLWLANTVLSYCFFSYTQILLNAMQKGYEVNNYNTIFLIITTIASCIILVAWHNYFTYLVARIVIGVINNWMVKRRTYIICPYLRKKPCKRMGKDELKRIWTDVYSIFVFKVSSTVSTSIDSIVISMFFGTVIVGYNGNYDMLITGVNSIIYILIYSFSSGVGDMNVVLDKESKIKTFHEIDFINFVVVVVAFSGIWNLSNCFIRVWLHNENFIFPDEIVFMKAFIMLYQGLLYACFVFRESMGLFEYAKYRNLVAGILNWILTVVMAKLIGIHGVFLSSIISSMLISVFIFPKVVFKYGFESSYRIEQLRYVGKLVFAIAAALVCRAVCRPFKEINTIWSFLLQAVITVVVCLGLICAIFHKTDEFKGLAGRVENIVKRKIENR